MNYLMLFIIIRKTNKYLTLFSFRNILLIDLSHPLDWVKWFINTVKVGHGHIVIA